MKYKIVFLPQPSEYLSSLKVELGKDFFFIESAQVDEFDQTFRQSGKFLILFDDARAAMLFKENHLQNVSDLEFEIFVSLSKNGKFKPESQRLLDEARIRVFQLKESGVLRRNMIEYFNPKLDIVDDLEFLSQGSEGQEE